MSNYYTNRKVLVTGGLGFIGSNLAIALVRRGAVVSIIDSMLPRYGANPHNIAPVADRVLVSHADLRDSDAVDGLVRDQEIIFSLAGQLSHLDSMRDPFTDLEINCRSQISLLESCRRMNPDVKLVFASTRQIYGRPQYLPVDEDHLLSPVDANGINKLAAERYYKLYNDVYGIRAVSLRLTNTYGPRMDLRSNTKGFIGVFVRKALQGETIEIFGDGKQRRDFNYVDDVVEAFLLAGEHRSVDGKNLNLGDLDTGSMVHDLLTFVQMLSELTGVEYVCRPFPPDQKAIDIGDYYGTSRRFHEATQWSPTTGLHRGLAMTIQFFRENHDHYL